jgi:hypothetical protein
MIMLLIVIGSIFSLAAALTSFLITFNEYLRGQKPDRRLALLVALKNGLVTFLIFAIITAGIGFAISKMF